MLYIMDMNQVCNIECGVPQGSILGTLLFLLYINDLCTQSNILHSILFADDTNILLSGRSIPDIVHRLKDNVWLVGSLFI